jgi:hypothetical protein
VSEGELFHSLGLAKRVTLRGGGGEVASMGVSFGREITPLIACEEGIRSQGAGKASKELLAMFRDCQSKGRERMSEEVNTEIKPPGRALEVKRQEGRRSYSHSNRDTSACQ